MYKLLIADSSQPFLDALQDIFCKEFDLQLCQDGETALELLQSFQPDALVINLSLPFKDGFTVLQETAFKPRVILATSSLISPYVVKAAEQLGVQFLTVLPTSINSLRVRLMDLIASTIAAKEDAGAQAAVLLHSLNFQPNLDGYRQLCIGIPLFAHNPALRLSKELYPQIALQFGLHDARSVEHSIRKAITGAWARKDVVVWTKFFPMDPKGNTPCPTNKEFIARLAEFINL